MRPQRFSRALDPDPDEPAPAEYPSQPPSVKLASDFYHPNAYPSGTVLPCWPKPDVAAETWPAELAKPCEPFILSGQAETRGSRWVEFAKVPPHLRLPLVRFLSLSYPCTRS